MNCCPLYSSDDGGPSFTVKTVRRAAKPHRCCECRENIPPGARYEHYTGKWGGEIDTFKTCLSCVEIRDHFSAQCSIDPEELYAYRENETPAERRRRIADAAYNAPSGFLFGELWSQLTENLFPYMTAGGPCFTGLSPHAKARLFDRRMTWLYEESDEWQRKKIFAPKARPPS